MLQCEIELYERQLQDEENVLIQEHASVCIVCGSYIELGRQNMLCVTCINAISQEEN